MYSAHATPQHPPHVTALFSDGVHSFQLMEGATISDLAERLGTFCAWHASAPLAVHVKLDPDLSNR